MKGRWVNTSGLSDESFNRLCRIADYLSYIPEKNSYASITMLNNPARIVHLQKRYGHELYEDPSDVVWRIMGSAVHDVMHRGLGFGEIDKEKVTFANRVCHVIESIKISEDITKDKHKALYADAFERILHEFSDYTSAISAIDRTFLQRYIAEERLSTSVCGVNISGSNDIYDIRDKKIIDYKTTGVDKVLIGNYEEWIQQLNGYAFLRRSHNFEVEALEVNVLLRDWMRRRAKWDRDYPKHSLLVISLPIWSFETQQEFFETKVSHLLKYENVPDDDIPICESRDRWEKPPKIAVVEVKKYIIHDEVIDKIQEELQPLDSITAFAGLEGEEYTTRESLYKAIDDACGKHFTHQYGEDICSYSAQRVYDSSGKKFKRAMRVTESVSESLSWVDWKKPSQQWALEHRPAEPIRCLGNYCGVRDYCSFWKHYQSLM